MNKIILGLGNPKKDYNGTRHNIGAEFVDWLRAEYSGIWSKKGKREEADITILDQGVLLINPTTFMNESGSAVADLRNMTESILVCHDDMDLAVGSFRFSYDRGSAGHKGVDSLIRSLGIKKFFRLRLGIGKANKKSEDFVTENFSMTEKKLVESNFPILKKAIETFVEKGADETMQTYNGIKKIN